MCWRMEGHSYELLMFSLHLICETGTIIKNKCLNAPIHSANSLSVGQAHIAMRGADLTCERCQQRINNAAPTSGCLLLESLPYNSYPPMRVWRSNEMFFFSAVCL